MHAHPAPPRRRLLRSAGAARRLDARRARAWCRRGARATCSSPTRSAPACSSRRRCRAFLPAVAPRAARRAADAAVGGIVVVRRHARRCRRSDRAALGQLVIKPAFPDAAHRSSVFGATLDRRRARRVARRGMHSAAGALRRSRSTCRCRTRRSGTTGRPREPRADAARVPRRPTAAATTAVMPGGLSRIAGTDRAGRVGPARRQQQGHVGAVGRAGRARSRCCPAGCGPTTSRAASAPSRAAPPSICSGWAATPSAARTRARLLRAVLSRLPHGDAERLGALARRSSRPAAATGCCRAERRRGAAIAPHEFERALIARHRSTPTAPHSLAFNVEQTRARRRRRARSPVVGQLAPAEPAVRDAGAAARPRRRRSPTRSS